MAKTITVTRGPGILRFPLEHNAKRYITDKPVEVISSPYYRRALNDGDLVLASVKAPAAKASAKVADATAQKDNIND